VIDAWMDRTGAWKRVNGHHVEMDVLPAQKISLLRSATAAGAPVEDLDIVPPTLDELYAHFLGSEEATR
jgi:Cu-processing system ATP-binding protein